MTKETQPPSRLYKYATSERLDVLTGRRIRFTQADALNDPFELRATFDQLASSDAIEGNVQLSTDALKTQFFEIYQAWPEEQKKKITFSGMWSLISKDPSILKKLRSDVVSSVDKAGKGIAQELRVKVTEAMRKQVGLLSLTESGCNAVMWAHYAGDHKGLVFEFDTSSRFFNCRRGPEDEFFHVRKICYTDLHARPRMMIEWTGVDILLTKAKEWEYEKEWRMLAPFSSASACLPIAGNSIYLFDLPPSAICGVLMGMKSAPELTEEARKILRSDAAWSHVTLSRVELDEANHALRAVEIPV